MTTCTMARDCLTTEDLLYDVIICTEVVGESENDEWEASLGAAQTDQQRLFKD